MISVVIIEDELYSAEWVVALLSLYAQAKNKKTKVVTRLETVSDAVIWLQENKHPDLIFLDVHLHSELSFEIFKQVKVLSSIIFTTAYEEYVIKSFEVNNIAYLLKPISKEKMFAALDKYMDLETFNQTKLTNLSSSPVKPTLDYLQSLEVYYRNTIRVISTKEIAYFYVKNKMVFLKTWSKESLSVSSSLNELLKDLNPKQFFQINRQMVIHIKSVVEKSIILCEGRAKIKVLPECEEEVVVSRNRLKFFRQWLKKH